MSLVISKKYKYIFFHLPKNAGVSVSSYLIDQELKLRIIKKINYLTKFFFRKKNSFLLTSKYQILRFNSHISCYQFFEIAEFDQFKDYYMFAVVRNPFDRMVSRYEYSKKINKKFKQFTFEDFVSYDLKNNIRVLNQFKFLTIDKKNKLINNFIKFENLNYDLNIVSNKLFNKNHNLLHLNKTNHEDYKKYFNNKSRNLIEKKLSKDLDFFEYEF